MIRTPYKKFTLLDTVSHMPEDILYKIKTIYIILVEPKGSEDQGMQIVKKMQKPMTR